MWPFVAKFSRFVILATATVGVSILISFVTKLNFNKIKPKSEFATWDKHMYHAVIMNNRDYKCSATLIDSKNVITLASCVRNDLPKSADKPSIRVRIGWVTVSEELDRGIFNVEKITLHPGYDHDSGKDDLAIIQLTGTEKFFAPISYLPKKIADKGVELYVTGYGTTEYFRSDLRSFNMTIIDMEKCKKHVPKNWPTHRFSDMSNKFCAVAEHGFDHPLTSWGSPATVDREYIVGIYLGHVGYENTPGIFINVSNYISFIEQHIS